MSIILFAIGKTPFFRSIFDNFIVIQKRKEKKEIFIKKQESYVELQRRYGLPAVWYYIRALKNSLIT